MSGDSPVDLHAAVKALQGLSDQHETRIKALERMDHDRMQPAINEMVNGGLRVLSRARDEAVRMMREIRVENKTELAVIKTRLDVLEAKDPTLGSGM